MQKWTWKLTQKFIWQVIVEVEVEVNADATQKQKQTQTQTQRRTYKSTQKVESEVDVDVELQDDETMGVNVIIVAVGVDVAEGNTKQKLTERAGPAANMATGTKTDTDGPPLSTQKTLVAYQVGACNTSGAHTADHSNNYHDVDAGDHNDHG